MGLFPDTVLAQAPNSADTAARWPEYVALGVYLAVLLWIGFRSARRVRTSSDYVLAGRNVPWVVLLATTAATMVGGGACVGTVSNVHEIGIVAVFITCGWYLQLMVTGLLIAPRLRRLNLVTVADFFGEKFGPIARWIAVANSILFLVGALAAQLVAMGTITSSFLEIQFEQALLIGAAITILYATVGGMRAVISTDVLQFVVLVAGIGAAAAILYHRHDGFAGLLASEAVDASHFSLTGSWSAGKVVSIFVAFLLGETLVPTYAMRCFAAEDPAQARRGIAGAGIFLLCFLPVATLVIGLSSLVEFPDIAAKFAFPALIRSAFPPVFAGVLIAALVAAVMSSGDSNLAAGSAVIMQDIYRRLVRPQATDRQLLRVAKISTLVGGVLATLWALRFPDVIRALVFVYDFWAPVMVLPFFVGVFGTSRRQVVPVVASMLAGVVAVTGWHLWSRFGTVPEDLGGAMFGLLFSVPVYFITALITKWRST